MKKLTPIKKVYFGENNHSFNLLFDRFKEYNEPFSITHTGYTIKIENEFISYLITERDISNYVFIAMNKIKKDYKNSNIVIDEIPKEIIHYYNSVPKNVYVENCFIVDFNSAYPTVLFNEKIITKDTYEFLMRMKKIERLMSIGALASKKIKFNYSFINNFEEPICEPELIYDNINAQLYFYSCYVIGEMLKEGEQFLADNFLFSWFDGIYFKDVDPNEVLELFDIYSYPCKVVELDYFHSEIINEFQVIKWLEKNKKEKIIKLPIQRKNINFAEINKKSFK